MTNPNESKPADAERELFEAWIKRERICWGDYDEEFKDRSSWFKVWQARASITPQSSPAVDCGASGVTLPDEQMRKEFSAVNPGFDCTVRKDNWSGLVFIHPHVESIYTGWRLHAALATPSCDTPSACRAHGECLREGAAPAIYDCKNVVTALTEVLEFQSAPSGPTIHDFGRWRRARDAALKQPATQAPQPATTPSAEPAADGGYRCPAQRGEDPRGCWRVRCQLGKKCAEPSATTYPASDAQQPTPPAAPSMSDAIAAGDGTLHGAIDRWQARALKAEAALSQQEPVDFEAREIGEGDWFRIGLDETKRIASIIDSPTMDYRWLYDGPPPAAQPAVPEGMTLVPIDVLEHASSALGNFVSDHGWGDSDMRAMDNLDAFIARHRAAPQQNKEQ